jgi:hypothetical protein
MIRTRTFRKNNNTITPTSILSAILLLSTTSIVGGLTETSFAQTDNNATTSTTGTETTTASSNASKMMGVIASMQLDENGNPAWITAGHWTLDSDAPLVGSGASSGNQTAEPQINNFNATIYMVKNEDGRDFHQHQISNFRQAAVTHQGANSTTVNGTFTITLQQGPVDNVNGYIHVINDKIELWVDPVASDNHFGPTTITGMVLSPERFSELMSQ